MIGWLLPEDASVFAILRDIAIALGAAATGYAAVRGLRVWRAQVEKRHIARRLLDRTYALRDAIADYRAPLEEVGPSGQDGAAGESERIFLLSGERERASMDLVYSDRSRLLSAARVQFRAAARAAKTLWGKEIREATGAVLKCVKTLYRETDSYLDKCENEEWLLSADGKATQGVLQSQVNKPNEDKFLKEVEAAVSKIEAAAKPHLTP
ncbi:MAG: hypothetical protein JW889_08525 [Verrucomicrobia bacterium]|nr:hypothetical protein [Verrucomicrobiota bacterium]